MHNNKEDEVEEEVGSSPGVRFCSLFQGFRLRGRANECFSSRSLTSRHTPLSERLEQPCSGTTLMGSCLVSFRGFYPTRPPPSRRRLWEQGCAWNRLRFLESPGSFLGPKQTFKSKSLQTGSFKVILCAKLLKPQLFGAVNYRDFLEAGPWSPFLESPGSFSGPESCLHLPYLHSRSKFQ